MHSSFVYLVELGFTDKDAKDASWDKHKDPEGMMWLEMGVHYNGLMLEQFFGVSDTKDGVGYKKLKLNRQGVKRAEAAGLCVKETADFTAADGVFFLKSGDILRVSLLDRSELLPGGSNPHIWHEVTNEVIAQLYNRRLENNRCSLELRGYEVEADVTAHDVQVAKDQSHSFPEKWTLHLSERGDMVISGDKHCVRTLEDLNEAQKTMRGANVRIKLPDPFAEKLPGVSSSFGLHEVACMLHHGPPVGRKFYSFDHLSKADNARNIKIWVKPEVSQIHSCKVAPAVLQSLPPFLRTETPFSVAGSDSRWP